MASTVQISPVSPLWTNWLTTTCGLVIAFSLVLILVPDIGQLGFNYLLFQDLRPPSTFSSDAVRYIAFIYGVLGAVMIGWMSALLPIIRRPFAAGERWAWSTIAGSTALWFVIDSAFSWNAGFLANIALNVAFAVLFAVPLIGSRKAFWRRPPQSE